MLLLYCFFPNVSAVSIEYNMDDSSSNGCPNPELKEGSDNVILKMNMKFDGNTWKHCQNESGSAPDKEQTDIPSTSCGTSETKEKDANQQTTNIPRPSSPSSSLSNDDVDQEFEPSVDAMVHDFDDETTMEEEEEDDDGDSEELDDLTKEGEMPLEDLMALYYGKNDQPEDSTQKEPGTGSEISQSPSEENDGEGKNEVIEDRTRKLRSNATNFLSPPHQHHDSDADGDFDGDYAPPPEDWKKAPRVGENFQVDIIPDVEEQNPDYDDSTDKLVWDPTTISPDKVETYLTAVSMASSDDQNPLLIPTGQHLRDNEDALFLLTQCGNDTNEAIERFKWRPRSLASEMHVWSEDECRQFELGLSLYGKDFHAIHHNKVKTKAIGDIVKFYYIWKKTERYDNFNAKTRLGKKNILHPGVTDYMERLLDETEQPTSSQQNSVQLNHGAGSSSHSAPLAHSTALQQHLIDLRVTTRSNTRHRPHNHYGDSPSHEYSEMNGLLDSDFADDPGIFENIQPIPPHTVANLGNISPSVPFTVIEPTINVGYSDTGNFASLSSTITHPPVTSSAVDSSIASESGDVMQRHFQAAEVGCRDSDVLADQPKHSFRPLDPAEITPTLPPVDGAAVSDVRKTTPLPLDVLSSIDELESTYGKPRKDKNQDMQNSQEASRVPLKHPITPESHHNRNAKKSRTEKEDPILFEPPQLLCSTSDSSQAPRPSSSNDAPRSSEAPTPANVASNYQKPSQSGREKITDAPQLISC
uniref:Mesoderm induction early response protein 1 n=1 Tax=Phallusia mammillata TaxID=59560 RepID=A0A6F9DK62_9ASCI|nr:mesoderm induction early response protein 1 [Phallusia mammillata]